jgi:signal transduction histidine kinase/predicted RNA-binding protein with RPS1 domain
MRGSGSRLSKPKWDRIKGTHNPGMAVACTVVVRQPGGCIVKVGRKRLVYGYLREQDFERLELAEGKAASELSENDSFTAYVDGYDNDSMRLSLTAVPHNHAEIRAYLEAIEIGATVQGRVVDHGPPGVFVRLENDFDALLPTREVLRVEERSVEDILRVNDNVVAMVIKKDVARRSLILSVKRYLAAQEGTDLQEDEDEYPDVSPGDELLEQWTAPIATASRTVVVLEDDDVQRDGLVEFLTQCGHTVRGTSDLDALKGALASKHVDCVVLDAFVDGRNILGEALKFIADEYATAKVIVCSALFDPVEMAPAFSHRGTVIDVLLKPPELELLAQLADTLEEAEEFEAREYLPIDAGGTESTVQAPDRTGTTREDVARDFFHKACTKWPSDAVLVLHRPCHSRDPNLVEARGIDRGRFGRTRLQLKHSPVGDVLNKGKTLLLTGFEDGGVSGSSYITDFIDCSSMIGVPVYSMGQPEYGLFILRRSGPTLGSEDAAVAESMGLGMQAQLAQAVALEAIARQHIRLAMVNLFAGMAHETANSVSRIKIRMGQLMRQVGPLGQGTLAASEQQSMGEVIGNLGKEVKRIDEVLRTLLVTVSQAPHAPVELYKLLHEVYNCIVLEAELRDVHTEVNVAPELVRLKYPDVPLRQSVLNLALNALQHLDTCNHGRKHMRIAGGINKLADLPVWVSVSDTGRGVHENDRERLFEPYFTTRADGTGLGLYLTRWFVQSLGGRVSVSEAVRFGGTEFRIELPIPTGDSP